MEEIDYLGAKIYRWEVGSSTFLACPERGARLMNWNITFPDGGFRDIVSWPELDHIDEFAQARGGNPILFPFCARSFDGTDIHFWKDPTGTRRPMPMHGFARQGLFEVARVDKTGFSARLEPDLDAREAYPYEYDFEVIYRFREKELYVELRLTNRDSQPIPWSAGHHFYFNLPWIESASRADYALSLHAKKAAKHAADGSLFQLPRPKANESIANPDLIDRIHYQLTSPIVRCESKVDESYLEIEIGTKPTPRPDYALVTWTKNDDSPFYCIEPWMGPPNSAQNEVGLHLVPPGESKSFAVSVRV